MARRPDGEAIKEANKAKFSDKHYSGCVVAVDSKPFTRGFSREIGLDYHGAVDAALSKLEGKSGLFSSTMTCTVL